jgi:hypothetical protein
MATPRPWTVDRHDPIDKHEDNLWSVVGDIPNMALRRRMTLAKLRDGRVVVHNAVCIDELSMKAITDWGEVAVILVPNGFHRLDAHAWRDRFPKARVLCPSGATKDVRKVVEVDGDYGVFQGDDTVRLDHLDGVKNAEGVMTVTSGDHATLVFNDILFNQPDLPGFGGWVMKTLGSTGGPKVTNVAKWFLVKEKPAVQAHLLRLAETAKLTRLVPGHGDLVEVQPAVTLRGVANIL